MIVARVIKPATPFKSSVFREEILKAAKEIEQDVRKDFEKTTANWKHKVKFKSKVKTVGTQSVTITVTTDDKIYDYIDRGTKVRYATMSDDWKSKTEPNIVGTFPGKGRKLFVNKKYPRPGIKARNFTKHIAKTTQRELARVTKNALARAVRRSGHSIKK